ncbi:zinc finger protein 761-like [Dreissena polymorpha]|uniref:Uncharacterized protein n=1 Tax=Dreissena polymorpha TaxID=45954 RepID=A0A9D4GM64_DREPO|nr:zinc finger protein 761-like [Dreissena polymorpha]KAH3819565.1 hypothetical protein DPMN_121304 [Dreissena polymorpha]
MTSYGLLDDAASPNLPILSPEPDRPSLHQGSSLEKKSDFNILEKLKHLRDEKKFCDVVLEVRGVKFVAHKNVLASWSPKFAAKLFSDNPNVYKDYILVCYDNSEVFSDLLDFMYNGYVAPRETNFLQLLHLAVSFQIETLKNYCEEFLRCNLHLGNFVSTYFLSRKFKLDTLEEYIVGFLQLNLSDTVKQPEFLSLKAEKFNTFLSEGCMKKIKPEIKLFLIISWVGYDVQEREKYLVVLLGHINWCTVANDFLLEINRTENFFTSHESSLYLLLQTLYSAGIPLGPYKNVFPRLRDTHSAILKEVVHTSLLKLDTETFCPVTITVKERPHHRDACVSTNVRSLPCVFRDAAINTNVNSLHFQESECHGSEENQTFTNRNQEVPVYTQEAKYDQFETLGEFIEAEIHEIKLRESQAKMSFENHLETKKPSVISTIEASKPKQPLKKHRSVSQDHAFFKRVKMDEISGQFNMETRKSQRTIVQEKQSIVVENFEVLHEQDTNPKDNYDINSDQTHLTHFNAEVSEAVNKEDALDEEIQDNTGNKVKPNQTVAKNNSRECKKEVSEKEVKQLICQYENCAYITKYAQRMEKHIKTVHETTFELQCNLCQFETKEVRKYNAHMKTHFPGPPFKCDYPRCTYSHEKIQTMLIHRLVHTDDRPFTCDCGMRFRTNNTLIAHKKTHLGVKAYKCPECDVSFATRNTLNQHMVTHSDVRPYLCDLCGFSTKFQSHLIAHKRIHTGEVFTCTVMNCKYSSPKRSQLKSHLRSHYGIRSNICEICSKSFIERSHLLRHQKLHTNERINCEQCDYSTTRKDKLKEHMRKHHSGEGASPPKAKKGKSGTMSKNKNMKKVQPNLTALAISSSVTVDTSAPITVKWDHAGYSVSHDYTDQSTHGDGLLPEDAAFGVLRDSLSNNEPIQPLLRIDQINTHMNISKTSLDSGVIVSQNGILTGSMDGTIMNSSMPVLNILTNVDPMSVSQAVHSRMDTADHAHAYSIINSTAPVNMQQQEFTGLNAFMPFI